MNDLLRQYETTWCILWRYVWMLNPFYIHKFDLSLILNRLSPQLDWDIVGIMCRVLLIASLGRRMCIQIRISLLLLFGFGATTIGDTQSIYFSIISMSSSLLSSMSTCFRRWNGILLCGCTSGWTVLSTNISMCVSFNFPMPVNTFGNLS